MEVNHYFVKTILFISYHIDSGLFCTKNAGQNKWKLESTPSHTRRNAWCKGWSYLPVILACCTAGILQHSDRNGACGLVVARLPGKRPSAMGYFDRVLGRKPKDTAGDSADGASSAAPGPEQSAPAAPEIVHDQGPGAGFGPPSISSSSLPASGLPSMAMSADAPGGGGAGARLYDPYEGISQQVGMKKQLFKLPQQPEFLFEEEAAVRRRGWGENVQFYTGLGYITGEWWWAIRWQDG